MSLQAPGLGATLMTCLQQAGMNEGELAICVTTHPRNFPAGQTALTDIIRQIISDDAWMLEADLLPSFLASCRMCLSEAKPGALHNLSLEIARAALRSFPGGLGATLNPPVPDDEGDGAGDGDDPAARLGG